MTPGRRAAALLLLAAALGLAALGQYYFLQRRDYLWDGLVFHGLAVLCFALAWRQATHRLGVREARPQPQTGQGFAARLKAKLHKWSIAANLAPIGLLFSIVATLLSQGRSWNQPTGDVVVVWLVGIALVVVAAFWPLSWPPPVLGLRLPRDWRARVRAIPRDAWREAAGMTGLTVAALLLRILALESVPFTLAGDEAWFGLTARQVLSGELRNPFVTAYVSMPTLFYWPITWSMRLVGDGVTGLRLPAALVGAATAPILYLLARRLWGRRTALVSASFLAAYHYHIHYSRLGTNNIWDPFFAVLALLLLDLAAAGQVSPPKATRCYLLTGLVLGLSTYYYTGARVIPILGLTYFAFIWAMGRNRKDTDGSDPVRGQDLLFVIVAFLVAAGPILAFALSHPDDWNARINQVGIIQSGWLEREPGLTGKSTAQILAEQFIRAAGAFHAFADRTAFYAIDRPLLGPLAGIFALLGMAWSAARWRERRHFLVLIWFWAVIISGGMLTESPPSSQRLVIAIPAVALLVAIGLGKTFDLAQRLLWPNQARWANLILGVLCLVMVGSSLRFYYLEYTPSRRYGSANGETATMIGHYLQELDGEYRAYFLGPPRMYWGFGTMGFLAPSVPGSDVTDSLSAPPDFIDSDRGAVFILLPERLRELRWVKEAFADGIYREFYDTKGKLRFASYRVPPD